MVEEEVSLLRFSNILSSGSILTNTGELTLLKAVTRKKYCESVYTPNRRKTRTVNIGGVTVGSEHHIRVQTMTTTDTKDVQGTVEQVLIQLSILCYFNRFS